MVHESRMTEMDPNKEVLVTSTQAWHQVCCSKEEPNCGLGVRTLKVINGQ